MGTDRKTSLLRDRPAKTCGQARPKIWVSDAAHHCIKRRNDLLFTMSDNTRRRTSHGRDDIAYANLFFLRTSISSGADQKPFSLRSFDGQPSRFEEWRANRSCGAAKVGGARRDRTDDLLLAKQALSQLSYGPATHGTQRSGKWWAWEDLNFRPHAYQARALTN